MTAYFRRIDDSRFRASSLVGGAWNVAEQHVAPALGLLTHTVERAFAQHLAEGFQVARLSFDILGVLPIDVVELEARIVRPGRTVELVEASLSHDGRAAVTLRAWLMKRHETGRLAGDAFAPMPPLRDLPGWQGLVEWPGRFVRTVEVRGRGLGQGRAQVWVRPQVSLLEDEAVSPTTRLLSILDIANGLTPRFPPSTTLFPNVDLTAHLFAEPQGEWIGFDTTVAYGGSGLGVTHTVLHDETGPIGTSVQCLTVRPMP